MRGRQLPTLARLCFDVSVELSVSPAALHCLQCFNAGPVLCWARTFGKCQKRQKSSADEVFASFAQIEQSRSSADAAFTFAGVSGRLKVLFSAVMIQCM